MLLSICTATKSGKIPFKFLNVWADCANFLQLVQDVWGQNLAEWRMKNIWLKLKALKPRLKILNNEEFKTITTKIDQARGELQGIREQIVSQCTDYLPDQEKAMFHQLEKWSLI